MARNALQKIEDHEKLCRIMQKQTHDKIHKLERQINRVESILLVSTGALISGMAYVIFALIIREKNFHAAIETLYFKRKDQFYDRATERNW